MLAGLSRWAMCKTPPGCCAESGRALAISNAPATMASPATCRRVIEPPVYFFIEFLIELLVEPGVFEPPAVVIAVHHHRVPLEVGLPAGGRHGVEDRRPRSVLRQLLFDLPDEPLTLVVIGFHRLLVDEIVDLLAAIAGVVPLGAADEVLVELLVGVVEPVFADG